MKGLSTTGCPSKLVLKLAFLLVEPLISIFMSCRIFRVSPELLLWNSKIV